MHRRAHRDALTAFDRAGRPSKLKNELRRPKLEKIGERTTLFESAVTANSAGELDLQAS